MVVVIDCRLSHGHFLPKMTKFAAFYDARFVAAALDQETKRSAPGYWRARLSECCDVDAAPQWPDRHIRNLVAHTAFKGLDANEIGCARISVMAGGNCSPQRAEYR